MCPNPEADEAVHDRFARLHGHPGFVFGAIFVRDDMTDDQASSIKTDPKYAEEEQLVAAGFAYIENASE